MGPAQLGRECFRTFCGGILYGTWSEWRLQVRISQHLYPFTLYQYLFLTIGLLSRIVSENKCTCTRSRCSYSGIPQRVWASKTRTCGLPSSPASMSPLLVLWIRFPPSPQSSTTSATESSRRSNRKTRSRRPYSRLLRFLLRSCVHARTSTLQRHRLASLA